MSDEKPLDLTDQFAMAALQILVRNDDDLGSKNKFTLCNDYIMCTTNVHGESVEKISESSKKTMDRLAKVAYQMAKAMRKARLSAFE